MRKISTLLLAFLLLTPLVMASSFVVPGQNIIHGHLPGSLPAPWADVTSTLFDGSTSVVQFPSGSFPVDAGSPFSVTLWAYSLGQSGSGALLIGNDAPSPGWELYWGDGTDILDFGRFGNGNTEYIDSGSALSDNAWHHIVATYDGTDATGMKIYVDGSSSYTLKSNTSGGSTITTNPAYIGARGSDRYFKGYIDEVNTFNYVLNSSQVAALYNSGAPANPVPLNPNHEYRMGDLTDSASIIYDRIGSANGTATNILLSANVPGPRAGWTPASMPGLVFGVDPTTGLTTSQWNDTWSGNSNNFIAGATQPTLSTLNGRTVPSFTISTSPMQTAASVFSGQQTFTAFIVLKPADTSAAYGAGGWGGAGGTDNTAGFFAPVSSGGQYLWAFGGDSFVTGITATTSPVLLVFQWQQGTASWNKAFMRINGVQYSAQSGSTNNYPNEGANIPSAPFCINSWGNGGSNFNGQIGAWFITNQANTLTDIGKMETYIDNLFTPKLF